MKNTNTVPRYFYKLDKRKPQEIFQNGFHSQGKYINFFDHILGKSLNRHIDQHYQSAYISISESVESAVRHLGTLNTTNKINDEFYLYKIRPDKNIYCVLKTIFSLIEKMQKKEIKLSCFDKTMFNVLINQIIENFSYQKEWLAFNAILPTQIVSAQKIVKTKIDDGRNTKDGLEFYLPIPVGKEILNMGFEPRKSTPSFQSINLMTDNIIRDLNINETMLILDVSLGVLSSIGFGANSNIFQNHNSIYYNNKSVENSPYGHCFIDLGLINQPLKNKLNGKFKYSSRKSLNIWMQDQVNGSMFSLGWQSLNNKITTLLIPKSSKVNPCNFIYDTFSRITLGLTNDNISYALTAKQIEGGICEIDFNLSLLNNDEQNFYFEIVDVNSERKLLRLKSTKFPNFSLYKKESDLTNKLFFANDSIVSNDYHELLIVVSKEYTDIEILRTQKSFSHIIELGLFWIHKEDKYYINPKNNYSSKLITDSDTSIYYDLLTKKIFYLKNNSEVFALYNKRYRNASRWDWIRWARSDLKIADDERLKWYFEESNDESKLSKKIRSYENNDLLKIMVNNVNWGSMVTTGLTVEENFISNFCFEKKLLF